MNISIIFLFICSVASVIVGKITEKHSIVYLGFLGLSISAVGLVIATL